MKETGREKTFEAVKRSTYRVIAMITIFRSIFFWVFQAAKMFIGQIKLQTSDWLGEQMKKGKQWKFRFSRGNWVRKYCQVPVHVASERRKKRVQNVFIFHLSFSNWIWFYVCGFRVQCLGRKESSRNCFSILGYYPAINLRLSLIKCMPKSHKSWVFQRIFVAISWNLQCRKK